MHHPWEDWYFSKLTPLIPAGKRIRIPQKAVDEGRGYVSSPFQIEPYGVGTSESDRSETRTTRWKVFWESV